jgi:hypothetical protein
MLKMIDSDWTSNDTTHLHYAYRNTLAGISNINYNEMTYILSVLINVSITIIVTIGAQPCTYSAARGFD